MIISEIIKQKSFRFAEIVHLRIFGHEMGEEMRRFLGNLNYIFLATLMVGAFIFLLNVLAGRWLSIEEYGQYQLALSLSFFFVIPILMGLTTAGIHAIAKEKSNPKKIISSILPIIFIFCVIFVPLFLLFSQEIASIIRVEESVVVASILYTIFFSLYSVFRSILQGFLDFQKIALLDTVYAATALGSLVTLVVFGTITFQSPLVALGFGFLVFGILCIPMLRHYFDLFSFSIETGKSLFRNGLVMVAASVSGFLLGNVDKFIINSLIDISSVALYSAYVYSAGIFLNFFLQTFITVFFPSMSKIENSHKIEINKKINKLYIISSPMLFVLSFVFITLSIFLFGEKYELNYYYVFLFSFYIVIQFFISTKQWLLASFGAKGMLFSTYSTIIASVANVTIVYLLTEQHGLLGAIVGLIISLLLFVIINKYFLSLLLSYKK